jgi:hypothetical protein
MNSHTITAPFPSMLSLHHLRLAALPFLCHACSELLFNKG